MKRNKTIAMSMASGLVLAAGAAWSQEGPVKVGIHFGFTGPIESLTPGMADGAELAMSEVSESGAFLGGLTVESVRADSTCVDAAAATASAERLVTSDGVVAIVGSDCSGVTTAIANNVSIPNGILQISPSATSPIWRTTASSSGPLRRTRVRARFWPTC